MVLVVDPPGTWVLELCRMTSREESLLGSENLGKGGNCKIVLMLLPKMERIGYWSKRYLKHGIMLINFAFLALLMCRCQQTLVDLV